MGLAHDEQEYKTGLCALAALVFDHHESVCASLAVPVLAGTADVGDGSALAGALRCAAHAVFQALGHTGGGGHP